MGREVRTWQVWSLPRQALAVILTVDLAALITTMEGLHRATVQTDDLVTVAWLAGCAAIGVELTGIVERQRAHYKAGAPYKSPHAVWMIPALLLVQPGLACSLVAAHYFYVWLRVERFRPHRWIYSGAVSVVGTGAASAVYHALSGPSVDGELQRSMWLLPSVVLAGLVVTLNNLLLIGIVIRFAQPGASTREAFGGRAELLIGAVMTSMGVLVAAAVSVTPPLALAMVPVLYLVQRSLLVTQLLRAAETDSKTGLANAMHWRAQASREMNRATRTGAPLCVIMVDLDYFKRINDKYGHLAGDKVLCAIARIITEEVRSYDVAGRFGGEEFVVLVLADLDLGLEVAERIRDRISKTTVTVDGLGAERDDSHVVIDGLSASIGVACFPTHGRSIDALLKIADEHMYRAKASGRDQVVCTTT